MKLSENQDPSHGQSHHLLTGSLFPVLIVGFSLAIAACGSSGGGVFAPVAEPAPTETPPPPPPIDLRADELSPNGCLDLSLVNASLRGFPSGIFIREYTTGFSISKEALDGKPLARSRNMAAESALSALSIDEKISDLYASELAEVRQDGCATVAIDGIAGAKEIYTVLSESSTKSILHLKSLDGTRERVYNLRGPRELEITNKAPRIDRCPDFQRANATSTQVRQWGTASEMEALPIKISSVYLRQISIAVEEMPVGLSDLLSQSSSEFVEPTMDDLRALRRTPLDPQVVHCPFHAKPPSADEPPPPEEDPSVPTPTPTPSSSPTATPVPESTPSATPTATPAPPAPEASPTPPESTPSPEPAAEPPVIGFPVPLPS